jgi:competence protein ComEC
MQQWKLIFALLLLSISTTWLAIFSLSKDDTLKVIACDVGQGDAFLITQGKTQVLIDGGPGSKVIDCLGDHIPFWDSRIEVIVLSHPQADHYEGLIEVFRRYKVDHLIASELNNSTEGYEVLKKEVGSSRTILLNPLPSKDIQIGLMYLDILYPLEISDIDPDNVLGSNTSEEDPNNFSVVLELRYSGFEMLFTGDIGPQVMDEVIGAGVNDIDVLKVPHHGSKNGLTADLLVATKPELAVISAGKKNRFGHPHTEVIQMLREKDIEILRTDELSEIVIYSDGEKIWY